MRQVCTAIVSTLAWSVTDAAILAKQSIACLDQRMHAWHPTYLQLRGWSREVVEQHVHGAGDADGSS